MIDFLVFNFYKENDSRLSFKQYKSDPDLVEISSQRKWNFWFLGNLEQNSNFLWLSPFSLSRYYFYFLFYLFISLVLEISGKFSYLSASRWKGEIIKAIFIKKSSFLDDNEKKICFDESTKCFIKEIADIHVCVFYCFIYTQFGWFSSIFVLLFAQKRKMKILMNMFAKLMNWWSASIIWFFLFFSFFKTNE